jgi:hypothetical protein
MDSGFLLGDRIAWTHLGAMLDPCWTHAWVQPKPLIPKASGILGPIGPKFYRDGTREGDRMKTFIVTRTL